MPLTGSIYEEELKGSLRRSLVVYIFLILPIHTVSLMYFRPKAFSLFGLVGNYTQYILIQPVLLLSLV